MPDWIAGEPRALSSALGAACARYAVAEGNRFDYARFGGSEDFGALAAAAAGLAGFDCARLGVGKRLPFWLNVYNAAVLRAVIECGSPKSVHGVPWFFSALRVRVHGMAFSLDDIEHGLLRGNAPRYGALRKPLESDDPRLALAPFLFDERVHFAMHSACRSSPSLRAYGAGDIGDALEAAARAYVASQVRVEESGARLAVPKLFQWYAADFGGEAGVREFVVARLERDEDIEAVDRRGGSPAVRYLDFDWSLNAP